MSAFAPAPFAPITETELDAWIAELIHGERQQATGQLRKPHVYYSTGNEAGYGYCCLGLKCEIEGFDLDGVRVDSYGDEFIWADAGGDDKDSPIPEPIQGLSYETRKALAQANDRGASFAEIAAALNLYRDTILAGGDLKAEGRNLEVAK